MFVFVRVCCMCGVLPSRTLFSSPYQLSGERLPENIPSLSPKSPRLCCKDYHAQCPDNSTPARLWRAGLSAQRAKRAQRAHRAAGGGNRDADSAGTAPAQRFFSPLQLDRSATMNRAPCQLYKTPILYQLLPPLQNIMQKLYKMSVL